MPRLRGASLESGVTITLPMRCETAGVNTGCRMGSSLGRSE